MAGVGEHGAAAADDLPSALKRRRLSGPSDDSGLICDVCDRCFTRKEHLRAHLGTETHAQQQRVALLVQRRAHDVAHLEAAPPSPLQLDDVGEIADLPQPGTVRGAATRARSRASSDGAMSVRSSLSSEVDARFDDEDPDEGGPCVFEDDSRYCELRMRLPCHGGSRCAARRCRFATTASRSSPPSPGDTAKSWRPSSWSPNAIRIRRRASCRRCVRSLPISARC